MTIQDILERFERPTKTGDQWLVKCPAHEDRKASLAVREGDGGRVLLHCHAGCSKESIVQTMGLTTADLFAEKSARASNLGEIDATYDYTDTDGSLLYQVVRYAPKDFRQRCPDGAGGWTWKLNGIERVVYRLPDLKGREAVAIVEGEKDVEALWAVKVPATCNAGGAGKWRDEYVAQLQSAGVKRVRIIPDNDTTGRDHADQIARSCVAADLDARIVTLPDVPEKGRRLRLSRGAFGGRPARVVEGRTAVRAEACRAPGPARRGERRGAGPGHALHGRARSRVVSLAPAHCGGEAATHRGGSRTREVDAHP
jgi:5S rRNA maturation endonuclease (ribonuclease M5)